MYKGPERRTPEAGRRARDAHAVELWDAIEELGKLAAVQAGRNHELENILRQSSGDSELAGMRRAILRTDNERVPLLEKPLGRTLEDTGDWNPNGRQILELMRRLELRVATIEQSAGDPYELAARVKILEDAPATAPTAGSVLEVLEGIRIRVERLERTDKERNTELANVVRMLHELTGDVRALEGART